MHFPRGFELNQKKGRMFLEELENSLVKPNIEGTGAPRPRRCRLGQTAAELTKHSIHTISNTKSIRAPASTPIRTATTSLRPTDPKRKRCQVCPSSKDGKTNVMCFKCKKISAKNTLKVSLFATHASKHTHIHKFLRTETFTLILVFISFGASYSFVFV